MIRYLKSCNYFLRAVLHKWPDSKMLFGGKGIFVPSGSYPMQWQGNIAVVGKLNTPTMDYYFKSRSRGVDDIIFVDTEHGQQLISSIKPGAMLILVRDVPLEVIKQVKELKNISGVIWFIDDDIPGAWEDGTLPRAYQKKLSGWYRKAKPLLQTTCDSIWVSTPYLAEKYKLTSDNILPPVPLKQGNDKFFIRCFYHGSGSHVRDWDFIIEVIRKIQERNKNFWFEFIGDHALYKKCRNIPRVNILHPMPWQDYFALTNNRVMDIGLVPLIDTEFNRARSHTKFIDIFRQNAVGIYSNGVQFSEQIKECNAGLIVNNDVDKWVVAIEQLAKTDRRIMHHNASQLLQKITDNSFEHLARILHNKQKRRDGFLL